MIRRAFLQLPVVALIQEVQGSESPMAREAMRNVQSLLAAIRAGNTEAVQQLLSDEFFYVNSTGTTANKAQFVARLRSGDLRYTDLALRHHKICSYSDNVVINGELHIEGSTNHASHHAEGVEGQSGIARRPA